MKAFLCSSLVLLSLVFIPSLADAGQPPTAGLAYELFTVQQGSSKTLLVSGMTRIALEDPDIAEVEVTGEDSLRIDGRKIGETKLIVWTSGWRRGYRIVVEK